MLYTRPFCRIHPTIRMDIRRVIKGSPYVVRTFQLTEKGEKVPRKIAFDDVLPVEFCPLCEPKYIETREGRLERRNNV